VAGLTGVVAISATGGNTVALKRDGTVWAWGINTGGQLGDRTTTDQWSPVRVAGLTGVVAVSTAQEYTIALKDDGTVWAWGINAGGQLGDGTTTNRLTPVQVIYGGVPYIVTARESARSKPIKDPTTGMELVFVKGGCFSMGDVFNVSEEWSSEIETHEKPVHEVCVGDIYMGKFEVTQGEWKKVMRGNPSEFKRNDRHPVEMINWYDAQEYIKKLNRISKQQYRLPTEAEWEYAAKSGGKTEQWAGTSSDSELGEYISANQVSTASVGGKKPNGLGLYDMTGNVSEWCNDWYDDNYYSSSPKKDPPGPSTGTSKVVRGGSWMEDNPWLMRNSMRGLVLPEARWSTIGLSLIHI